MHQPVVKQHQFGSLVPNRYADVGVVTKAVGPYSQNVVKSSMELFHQNSHQPSNGSDFGLKNFKKNLNKHLKTQEISRQTLLFLVAKRLFHIETPAICKQMQKRTFELQKRMDAIKGTFLSLDLFQKSYINCSIPQFKNQWRNMINAPKEN